MRWLLPRNVLLLFAAVLSSNAAAQVRTPEIPVEKVFAAVPFDLWVKQGPATEMPWRVKIYPDGLSLQQRMRVHIDVQLQRHDLMKYAPEDRMVVLVDVANHGKQFRDYMLFRVKDAAPEIRKGELDIFWDMYVVPGEYRITVALADAEHNEHNLIRRDLRVESPRGDPLPSAWQGLPEVEFLAHMQGPDALFRSDIKSRLHLPLATKEPVLLEVLADVTASDLFHGSTSFYNRYLSVALPLLKALSQIDLQQGTIDVATLDLRRRRVTFEQDGVDAAQALDWPRARNALAPENGAATVDIKALEQKRESPAFLQDELLRRLSTPADGARGQEPLHVFVIIGSPMDFYSFRDLPHLPPGSEEKCVVYYLQFELLNPQYADGAIGNVRRMLKPLSVHVFKVRSAESIRQALAKMLEELRRM